MVGPTLHSTLTDVLLRFRLYPVAITADISKMYRAVELATDDKDYNRFVWRREPEGPLTDLPNEQADVWCFRLFLCR